jgi:hypothetical protein
MGAFAGGALSSAAIIPARSCIDCCWERLQCLCRIELCTIVWWLKAVSFKTAFRSKVFRRDELTRKLHGFQPGHIILRQHAVPLYIEALPLLLINGDLCCSLCSPWL